MDWYESATESLDKTRVSILTDLIAGEGFKKLINEKDEVFKLVLIDWLLLNNQSRLGDIWRNVIKLLVFPIQVLLLKRFNNKFPSAVYHAHSMYYLALAWAAGVSYVGTPQGSDLLVKPFSSKFYKYFAIKSLKGAKAITVDSYQMKKVAQELAGVDAKIIQNGIDIKSIKEYFSSLDQEKQRKRILSIRGFTALYRIGQILSARKKSKKYNNHPITFIYPFKDLEYKKKYVSQIEPFDTDLGRVSRGKMYELLSESKLVLSIPSSDSSPRSVYEAIFCGAIVAIDHHPYYDNLPQCMKDRIILIDLDNYNWFYCVVDKAKELVKNDFEPSTEALNLFDQRKSFESIKKLIFN